MKNIIVLILLIFSTNLLLSQQYNYFEGSTNLEITIDTTQINNIWQIGKPNKFHFTSANSEPNAIITDTLVNLTGANLSSFYCTINYNDNLWNYPYFILMFSHKMDIDSFFSGGWIEASYDGGNTWNNIYSDPDYNPAIIGFSPHDTLVNGEIGFSSNFNSEWKLTTVCWGNMANQNPLPPIPDSIIMKFNFFADSSSTDIEGWMLDNFEIYPEIIHTTEELLEMSNSEALVAYPNPVSSELNLLFRIENESDATIRIIGLNGEIFYQKQLGFITKGIYSESINSSQINNLPDFFILNLELENRSFNKKMVKKLR